ncbi:alpha-mannosidase [Spiroplasma sabaudiense Ar-1343]|uniref:Alpha-mannosidase n=1 Tax=Spiroplasma sabaudiense Ar-1343 TaxID=1276257 RepID=W6AB84_9MOLU|nr:glycoside hydrolase family 38 C-terminal domain-containing protein [Spiroplasma sabaudiense]AHI54246.1 alpha-mannosidase [Spiroplasma sabaudiense Ar-1343]
MNKKWRIHFVPHTHWDKEWYFTKEVSTVFLVDNIQKLKSICDNLESFKSIVFDSQLSIIDDYLSYFPEDEKIINKLIKDKKLLVGPWYTQPDMFNTNGESIIRNLVIGKLGSEKRGHSLKNAYTPDSFGFNSNMPQILKSTECDTLIQWRGVNQDHIEKSVYSEWKGIDGSKVDFYNIFKYGYGLTFWAFDSVYKKWDKKNMSDLAKEYLDKFSSTHEDLINWKKVNKNTGNVLCFPFGSDQAPIIEWLPLFVDELNKIDLEHEWILSDYDSFCEDIKKSTKNLSKNEIQGELKYGQYSRTHRTIASSRYDIKLLSKKVENQLYNEAEPMGLIYQKFTGKYPERIFEKANKLLLECHAHDSLGGSCTDETNREIIIRLKQVQSMLESQTVLIKRRITEYLNLQKKDLIIFNPLPFRRSVKVVMPIVTRNKKFEIFKDQSSISYRIINQKFYNRDQFIIENETHYNTTNNDEKGFYVTEIEFLTPKIDGLFYDIFKVSDDELKLVSAPIFEKKIKNKLEINDIGIEVLKNGDILMTQNSKETIISLEAMFDAGDTYDFSPSKINRKKINELISTNNFTIQDNNLVVVDQNWKVFESLESPKKIDQNILIKIFINSESVDIKINLLNKAKDIRWRILWNTKTKNDFSFADQSGSLIKRPVIDQWNANRWEQDKWKDNPVCIETCESLVYLNPEGETKYSIFTIGNNEYEIIDKDFSTIAVTLFRGVSLIGRRGLEYRPGRASGINDYPYATPESNLLEEMEFNFNFKISNDKNIAVASKMHFLPTSAFQKQNISVYLFKGQTFWMSKVDQLNKAPKPSNLFEWENNFFVACAKKSYNNNEQVFRLYNPSEKEVEIKILDIGSNLVESNSLERQEKKLVNKIGANKFKTIIKKGEK